MPRSSRRSRFRSRCLLTFGVLFTAGSLTAAPGDLDTTFGIGGKASFHLIQSGERASDVKLQADGKILVDCSIIGSFGLLRLSPDGTLDPTFGSGGKVITPVGTYDASVAVAVQPDGKIIQSGRATQNAVSFYFALVRYNTNGTLDTAFGTGGKVKTPVDSVSFPHAMTLQPDGKILQAGYLATGSTLESQDFVVMRYLSNGVLDSSFSGDGVVTTDFGNLERCVAIAVQSDGKIVAAGYSSGNSTSWALARYHPNGTLDTSFNGNGKLLLTPGVNPAIPATIALQPDGKILLAGQVNNRFGIVRLQTNGVPDSSFGTNGVVTFPIFNSQFAGVAELAVQPDGKIVAVGNATSPASFRLGFAVARLQTNGVLDSTFHAQGYVTNRFGAGDEYYTAVALQPDGRIVAAGVMATSNDSIAVVRYAGDPSPPEVTTLFATDIQHDRATLQGVVGGRGGETLVHFDYGLDSEYGNSSTFTTVAAYTSAPVSLMVTGLLSHTTYHFRIAGTNAAGAAVGSNLVFATLNRVPIASDATFLRAPDLTLKIRIPSLLQTYTSDPDADPVSLTVIGSATNGVAWQDGPFILYTATNNLDDWFSYSVADAFGGAATGTLHIQVLPTVGLAQSLMSSGGSVRIDFAGIPEFSYVIERAESPGGPWTQIYLTNAPAEGLFTFVDPVPPMPTAFYRLRRN